MSEKNRTVYQITNDYVEKLTNVMSNIRSDHEKAVKLLNSSNQNPDVINLAVIQVATTSDNYEIQYKKYENELKRLNPGRDISDLLILEPTLGRLE
jgi:hypothetical protein